jgi:hypothetical protein
MLKNYCARSEGVKFPLKMLIYNHKLRFFGEICLLRPSLITFFNTLIVETLRNQSANRAVSVVIRRQSVDNENPKDYKRSCNRCPPLMSPFGSR